MNDKGDRENKKLATGSKFVYGREVKKRNSIKIYCIIGPIGSGKSTLSKILSEKYLVQDSDKLARTVVDANLDILKGRFGPSIFVDGDEATMLDREELSARLLVDESDQEWMSNFVSGAVLNAIQDKAYKHFQKTGEALSFAEVTAPTYEVTSWFDGMLVIEADLATALIRTDNRENKWSRQKRARFYKFQSEDIGRCVYYFSGPVIRIDNSGSYEKLKNIAAEVVETIERIEEQGGFETI